MINQKNKEILKKQHYVIVGKHSAVQVCRWTKKDLLDEGECYKARFYGIKSFSCCEMSPSAVWCDNKCIHCWRAIENTQGNKLSLDVDKPKSIIEECTKGRRKLLSGFKGNKRINLRKWQESQEPSHFAISLIGEPAIYSKLGELIKELRKSKKTSFLVTNGLHTEALKRIAKNNQLPTQLYLSLNSPNKKLYDKWHNSYMKNAWKKFNQSLSLMKKLRNKTRTIIRMTLVKGEKGNMNKEYIKEYSNLIKKANPLFVEVKGFMSVGFSRQRLGYETMPNMDEVKDFAYLLAKSLSMSILDKHEYSRIFLLGKSKDKRRMKIKKSEI